MNKAKCHPNRKIQARELCRNCYDKWLKSINPFYRTDQISNSTKWAKKYPEKIAIIQTRRRLKESADPSFKIKKRDAFLKRKYGISYRDYEIILSKQKHECKLCKRKEGKFRLHVDHSHESGIVRGLLCHQCNWYLGVVEADLSILDRIKKYLEK